MLLFFDDDAPNFKDQTILRTFHTLQSGINDSVLLSYGDLVRMVSVHEGGFLYNLRSDWMFSFVQAPQFLDLRSIETLFCLAL